MNQKSPESPTTVNETSLQVHTTGSPPFFSKFDAGNALEAVFQQAGTDLRHLAQTYLTLQIRGVKSPETFRHVTNDLSDFLGFFHNYFRCFDVYKWTPQASKRYIEFLGEKGRKPATIARRLISIRAFGRWLYSHRPDLLPLGDPTAQIKPPVQEAIRPKCLTDRQVKAILDVASQRVSLRESTLPGRKKDRRPRRDRAIIMLLLNGGLRRSEVCELKLDQFQGKKLVDVKCKGNFFRDLFLGQETSNAVQEYLNIERTLDLPCYPDTACIFLPAGGKARRGESKGLSSRSVNLVVKSFLKDANAQLPAEDQLKAEELHPHAFRHTHAYKLIVKSNIAHVQKRLGHKRPDLVVRYAQMPEAEERSLIEEVELN